MDEGAWRATLHVLQRAGLSTHIKKQNKTLGQVIKTLSKLFNFPVPHFSYL